MLRAEHARLISFFIGSSGYLVPRLNNDDVKVSKTIHPFLLGKRNIYFFYNLEKSLFGIRATLEVLKNIISSGGEILFVSDSPVLKYAFEKNHNIRCIRWKRMALTKSREVDLLFLSNINPENLVEAHRKCGLLVGVGGSTMSQISYPFNLNIESTLLAHWFFSSIYTTCGRGKKENLNVKNSFSSLLGKGLTKKVTKTMRKRSESSLPSPDGVKSKK